MASVHIRIKVEGDTLVLPELRPLIGKTVDIEVTERSEPDHAPTPVDRWHAAAEAVKELHGYDFRAWSDQRAFDAQHGTDHLR
jgi:hypothetical protein